MTGVRLLLRDALALLLFLAPVLVVVWPVLGDPGGTVLGGSFVYGHLWSWELVSSHGIELSTRTINYPEGGVMTLIGWSFIGPLLALRALGFGVVAAANLLAALHLLAGCYLAYRLALRLTDRFAAAVVGGLGYGLCPLVLSLVWNGQYPKLVHGLLPLVILLLVRLADGKRWPLLALPPTLALLLASSPYLGIFGAVVALLAGIWLLARGRADVPRPRLAVLLAAAGALSLLAATPFFLYWGNSSGATGGEQLLAPAGTGMDITAMSDFRATLGGWFDPRPVGRPSLDPFQWDVVHVHYLGWVGLILALAGLVLVLRGRPKTDREPGRQAGAAGLGAGFFLALGVVFVGVAQGPYAELGSLRIPLPMQWIWDAVPQSRALYATYRAAVVVSLALAMLASMGLSRLVANVKQSTGLALCAAAGLLVLGEALLVSPAPFPIKSSAVPSSRAYQDLASSGDCGAVLVVPYGVHDESLAMEVHRFHQTFHRHPLVHGVLKTRPRAMAAFHDRLYQAVTGHAPPPRRRARPGAPRLHFRYVLLHERLIRNRERLPGVRAFLDGAARLVRHYPAEGIRLYQTRQTGPSKKPPYPRSAALPAGQCL